MDDTRSSPLAASTGCHPHLPQPAAPGDEITGLGVQEKPELEPPVVLIVDQFPDPPCEDGRFRKYGKAHGHYTPMAAIRRRRTAAVAWLNATASDNAGTPARTRRA
jgi:hypothetical protein